MNLFAVIDGERIEFDDVHEIAYPTASKGRRDWYMFENAEHAGREARAYWENMAENDPKEFACIVGEETLIQWDMGHSAGPGFVQVRGLAEWLDLWLDTPEEQWGSYDGSESEVTDPSEDLIELLGFTPTVAYRHN